MEKERKQNILKAAEKRFSRHGLNKTTLDEIARDLRIGKATIYNYFATKEELYFKTIEWQINIFLDDLKPIFSSEHISIKEKLVEYFNLKSSAYLKYKLIYEILFYMLKEEVSEKEAVMVKMLLDKETEFLKQYLPGKKEQQSEIAHLFVIRSWGNMFTHKIHSAAYTDKNLPGEYLFKFIESIYS